MSTVANTITDLPHWALLTMSAVCGIAIVCAGALLLLRYYGGRDGERSGGGDSITGVANRREFINQLENAWQTHLETGDSFGLLVVDIDAFGEINLVHGRAAGDRVLAEVAERILLRVRSRDFVARIDADEFTVICDRISGEQLEAMRESLEAYVNFAQSVPVTLSIGVATPQQFDGAGLDLLDRARESLRLRRTARPDRIVDEALSALLVSR